jgi:cytoplasmic iron level regulating protein YaaA (DUF328/UPF0246 family)
VTDVSLQACDQYIAIIKARQLFADLTCIFEPEQGGNYTEYSDYAKQDRSSLLQEEHDPNSCHQEKDRSVLTQNL